MKRYPKEKYIILDYFVLDLESKDITIGDLRLTDGFSKTIGEIKNIRVENTPEGKKIIITPTEGEDIIIELDKQNRIIGYINDNVTIIRDNFLYYNSKLKKLSLSKAQHIGYNFCLNNHCLEEISLEEALIINGHFLNDNTILKKIYLPKAKVIDSDFCYRNVCLEELVLEEVEYINGYCLPFNRKIRRIVLPSVRAIGQHFCNSAKDLEEFYAPLLKSKESVKHLIKEGYTRVRIQ